MTPAPDDETFASLFEAPGLASPEGEQDDAESGDDLLADSIGDASRPGRAGRGLLVASIAALVVGIGVVSLTVLLGPLSNAERTRAQAVATSTPVVPTAAPAADALERLPAATEGHAGIADRVQRGWVTRLATRSGIPERALRAYTGAAVRAAEEFPGCGLGWNTLAGIGFVESEHGTHGGSRIDDDGWTRPGIIGIPLDGTRSEAIRDTDGGDLDGDAVWDRAVGPLQFIPSTWAEWGADGNGDGIADPQHVDDAALAAARYLCSVGGDLTQPPRWIAAVAAYNNTVEYNNRVAEAASHYASLG